jgi:enamine deaminase RidA (YjgF/YER057c/UK114 family)
MSRETINPRTLFSSTQYGFSHIIISNPGKLVFISGQVAWDENENIVGENNLEIQTLKAFDNLEIAIESAGGTLENIMMLQIYKVDYQPKDAPIISAILKEKFGAKNPPASTWINVKGLANEGFMIQIEAQAVI